MLHCVQLREQVVLQRVLIFHADKFQRNFLKALRGLAIELRSEAVAAALKVVLSLGAPYNVLLHGGLNRKSMSVRENVLRDEKDQT